MTWTSVSSALGQSEPHGDAISARSALANYLRSRVGSDGCVRDSCRSRIFESALVLRLLRLEQVHPEASARIVQYLGGERRRRDLDPFDKLLVASVLAGVAAPDAAEVERQLSVGERFATRRKQRLFRAVLA